MADPNMSMADGGVGTGIEPTVIPKADPTAAAAKSAAPRMPEVLPLWDPAHNMLRAIPANRAKEFQDMGWIVGGDAQVQALNHSGLAKVGAGSMAFSNAANLGLTDAMLSGSNEGKALLRTERQARENNSTESLLGSIGGVALLGGAGGFAGGLTEGALAKAAEYGTAAKLGAGAVDIALGGAPAMGVQGALDSITEDNLLNHPVSIQHMAAGALHNVVENAAYNAVGHGILKSAGGIRKAVGNSLDYAEKYGLLKREIIEEPGIGGEVKSYTKKASRSYRDPNAPPEAAPLGADRQLDAHTLEMEHSPSLEHEDLVPHEPSAPQSDPERLNGAIPLSGHVDLKTELAAPTVTGESSLASDLAARIDQHDAPNMAEIAPDSAISALDSLPKRPVPTPLEPMPYVPPHYPEYKAPIPLPRKPMREPSALMNARAQVEKYGSAAELAEFDSANAHELAAEAKAAKEAGPVSKTEISRADVETPEAAKPVKLDPENADFEFEWKKGEKPQDKVDKLRVLIGERVADVSPEATALWNRNLKLEKEITAIKKQKNVKNADAIIQAKINHKNQIKAQLHIMAPREVDEALGVVKPGFKDYIDEYARIKRGGKIPKDVAPPIFRQKKTIEEAANRMKSAADDAQLHEAKVAEDLAKQHTHALRQANAADDQLAKAEQKWEEAKKKVERLEEQFNEKVTDTTDYLDEKDARTEKIALRRHEERIANIERDARNKLNRLKIQNKNKEITFENQRALEEWRQEVSAKKAKIKADEKAAKKAEHKAEALAKEERTAKRQAETAAKQTQKAAEKKAARDAEKAANRAYDEAKQKAADLRHAQKRAEKLADQARQDSIRAENDARKERNAANKAQNKAEDLGSVTREYSDHEGKKTETTRRFKQGHTIHERVVLKVKPHAPPPTTRKGGYKQAWSGSDFANVIKGGFYTGFGHAATYATAGMAAHNAAIALANQRKVIGEAWKKYAGSLAKGGSVAYKAYERGKMREHRGSRSDSFVRPQDYPKVAKAINYLAENPEAVTGYMRDAYPSLAANQPRTLNSVAINIQKGIQEIYKTMPKKPFTPTLQNANFTPTRAQQVAVLKMWQALGNPDMALEHGDHTIFGALNNTYPDLQDDGRQQMMHEIQHTKAPIRGRKARQLSQFIGAPVRPTDDSGALKRMQQTAGPEPMKPPGQGGGSVGKSPHSAKITNQSAQRDMPTGSQHLLGG